VGDGTSKELGNNKKRRQANSQAQVVFKQVQPGWSAGAVNKVEVVLRLSGQLCSRVTTLADLQGSRPLELDSARGLINLFQVSDLSFDLWFDQPSSTIYPWTLQFYRSSPLAYRGCWYGCHRHLRGSTLKWVRAAIGIAQRPPGVHNEHNIIMKVLSNMGFRQANCFMKNHTITECSSRVSLVQVDACWECSRVLRHKLKLNQNT
jgi:hypothetical protein